MCNFFLNRGIVPKVVDTRLYPSEINNLPSFVERCFGRLHEGWILSANLLIVSPGVRLDCPILIEAAKLGIEIIGDIELFVREVTEPIIAITGSNGKSTVTQLVGNMAQYAGWDVGIAGNIGIPVLSLLGRKYQLYVLEISSFQLDLTFSLHAAAAIILNISEDHMDHYGNSLDRYIFSKKKIYQNAVVCIVNDEDPLAKQLLFDNCPNLVSFGVNSNDSDYHIECDKKNTWIVAYNQYLMNCSRLKIVNYIGYSNILSALALSDIVKIPRIASLKVLNYFYGLPHRFQLVYKNHGVSWINDSKATNVEASKNAICKIVRTLSGRLHLLLGGDSKLADFCKLQNLIRLYEIHLYCFGRDGISLTDIGFKDVILTDSMKDSIFIISRRIQKKDIVLLSPACSSLDQFKSFEDRGNCFAYFAQKYG